MTYIRKGLGASLRVSSSSLVPIVGATAPSTTVTTIEPTPTQSEEERRAARRAAWLAQVLPRQACDIALKTTTLDAAKREAIAALSPRCVELVGEGQSIYPQIRDRFHADKTAARGYVTDAQFKKGQLHLEGGKSIQDIAGERRDNFCVTYPEGARSDVDGYMFICEGGQLIPTGIHKSELPKGMSYTEWARQYRAQQQEQAQSKRNMIIYGALAAAGAVGLAILLRRR
jgi:hypothetical protein